MKERFEIYDGSAESKKAKGKSKNLLCQSAGQCRAIS